MNSGRKNLHWGLISFSLILVFSILINPVFGQETPHQPEKSLNLLQWEGDFLSWHREGFVCWVEDSKGNLRFDLMLGGLENSPDNLNRLMEWNAPHGWTVITVEAGGGTFSRWNEEWQKLPPAMDTWLRVIASQCGEASELPSHVRDISPGGRSLALPMFEPTSHPSRVKRIQVPELNQAGLTTSRSTSGLRNRMTHRGHGRGGEESVLNVSGSAMGDDEMRITSSHQPGALHLKAQQSIPAEFSTEEVFLPWWPLSESVRLK